MVGPTKRKPRRFSSFDIARGLRRLGRELGERSPAVDLRLAADERPEQLVGSSCSSHVRAFETADSTFSRLRTIAGVGEQPLGVRAATTFAGSNPANARR